MDVENAENVGAMASNDETQDTQACDTTETNPLTASLVLVTAIRDPKETAAPVDPTWAASPVSMDIHNEGCEEPPHQLALL